MTIQVKAMNMATGKLEQVTFNHMTAHFLIDASGRRWFRATGRAAARPSAANMQLPGPSVSFAERHFADSNRRAPTTVQSRSRHRRLREPVQLTLAF